MLAEEDPLDNLLPKAEFKDTPTTVQCVQAGIVAAGGLAAWIACGSSSDQLIGYAIAGAVGLVAFIALVVVQKRLGDSTSLAHYNDRLVLSDQGRVTEIPFEQLDGFSVSRIDLYVNGVYSTTTVKLGFDVADSFRIHSYETAAGHGTVRHEQIETLIEQMSSIIAERMRETLMTESSVPWTAGMTITTVGLDCQYPNLGVPRLVPFTDLGEWTIKKGVFKLAINGDRRVSIDEPIAQTNFLPGLKLFSQLHAEFAGREDLTFDSSSDPIAPPPSPTMV